MSIDPQILKKQFFSMTGSEILELFGVIAAQKTVTQDFSQKKYVYGISGLAKLLDCGKTKAQEIKNSGIIDDAIYQTGKKIVIDSEKALELIKQNPS